MPKLPPPPRSAQNRSGFCASSHSTICPSARTTVACRSRSQVNPYFRPRTPRPPPSVRPEIPTERPHPVGNARPCRASASLSSPSLTPASTVASPWSSTRTERISLRSMMMSPSEDRPAKQWPPERGVVRKPRARENWIVAATSAALVTKTTALGRAYAKRVRAGFLATS